MKVTGFHETRLYVALLLINHDEQSQTLFTSPLVLYRQESFHQGFFSNVLSALLKDGLNCSVL